jgi:hypothetical protein
MAPAFVPYPEGLRVQDEGGRFFLRAGLVRYSIRTA